MEIVLLDLQEIARPDLVIVSSWYLVSEKESESYYCDEFVQHPGLYIRTRRC
jgi:hypothetical protein